MLCRLKNTKGISAIVISAILRINSMSAKQKDSLPKLEVKIGIDNEVPKEIETVPDTGAQATVGGPQHMHELGIEQCDLRAPNHALQHAGGNNLEILGSYPIYMVHNDKLIEDEIYFVMITDDDSLPSRNFGSHALTPSKNRRENSLLS